MFISKPKFETPDMTQKNIDKISQLFPNCITETKDENGKITVTKEKDGNIGIELDVSILKRKD